MKWQSRLSTLSDFQEAFQEVTDTLTEADLLTIFVPPHFSEHYQNLSEKLASHFPQATIIGCSAGGLAADGVEVEARPGLALTAATLPQVGLHSFHLEQADLPDGDAPPQAWHECIGVAPEEMRGMILLIDPFSFEPNPLLAGLDYAYPKAPKVGGLVSGARSPGQSALLQNGKRHSSGAVGLAFSGAIEMETLVAQGCRPIGDPLVLTECEDYTLVRLDNQNALATLSSLLKGLSKKDQKLASHSLFVGVGMGQPRLQYEAGDFLVRNVIGLKPNIGGIVVGADLRVGQTIQFHLRDAQTSAQDLKTQLSAIQREPAAALMFSCLGRGEGLYGEPHFDSQLVRGRFPDLPMAGFFCNGEIGPVGGQTYMHGYTTSLAFLRTP